MKNIFIFYLFLSSVGLIFSGCKTNNFRHLSNSGVMSGTKLSSNSLSENQRKMTMTFQESLENTLIGATYNHNADFWAANCVSTDLKDKCSSYFSYVAFIYGENAPRDDNNKEIIPLARHFDE